MPRPCILASLEPEQLDKLESWFETESYREVHKLVVKPPPEGLGVKASLATVYRFWTKFNGAFAKEAAEAAEETWAEICKLSTPVNEETEAKMVRALSKLVQDRMFHLLTDPKTSMEQLHRLGEGVARFRNTRLREASIQLMQQKQMRQMQAEDEGDGFFGVPEPLKALLERYKATIAKRKAGRRERPATTK